jgi:DNA mismatch repair protein MutS
MATCAHTLLGVLDHRHADGRAPAAALAAPAAARPRRRSASATMRCHLDRCARRRALRDAFRSLGDLERILSRVALRSARARATSPRCATACCAAARGAQILHGWIRRACRRCAQPWANTRRPRACCARPSSRNRPLLPATAACIADGYDAELDELRQLSTNADQFLVDLEAREREATGIATLKVGYNRVHGYYIEISKGQSDKAPVHYTRRQTLTGAERYITEELKAFEDKVLSARERSLSREKLLYEGVLDLLNEAVEPLRAAPPR